MTGITLLSVARLYRMDLTKKMTNINLGNALKNKQPRRPQGFSLKKWVGPAPPIFWGKSPGVEVEK